MLNLLVIEDNPRLQIALISGLEDTGEVHVVGSATTGEAALDYCLTHELPHVILMDVALASDMNGIQSAVVIRKNFPRLPVVFYSIQDDDDYYRAFRRSRILTHYAYVRKSNYLLPSMILPLLQDAVAGRSFVDPAIALRVQEVEHRDANAPMNLLEPQEQMVARLLAQGLTNEQIAAIVGFRDKRTISRTNGQIYAAWGLIENATDEKIARTRATIMVHTGKMIRWDTDGKAFEIDERGQWSAWQL